MKLLRVALVPVLVLALAACGDDDDAADDVEASPTVGLSDQVVELLGPEVDVACLEDELGDEDTEALNESAVDQSNPPDDVAQAFFDAAEACLPDDPGSEIDGFDDGDGGDEALAFFRASEAACIDHADATGNAAPGPGRFADAFVDQELEPGVWLVVDGEGDSVAVDLEDQVIQSADGPDAPLPSVYSFGCPPELYVGPADD